jgi:hypothetical protein
MTAKRHCNDRRSQLLPMARRQSPPCPVKAPTGGCRAGPDLCDPGVVNRGALIHLTPGSNRATKVMSLWCLFAALFLAMTACRASAQGIPILRLPTRVSAFATFTDGKPSFRYYGDRAVWGYTLGGIVQLPRFAGVEVRGSMLRYGGLSHHETILAGPRFSLRILHMSPYGSFLVGEGNSSWWSNAPGKGKPKPYRIEDHALQWTVATGIDIHFRNRITFRLGEVTYSKLFESTKTLTPLTASSGLVIRLK